MLIYGTRYASEIDQAVVVDIIQSRYKCGLLLVARLIGILQNAVSLRLANFG